MNRIFLSYRRQDASGFAGRLAEGLSAHFGSREIFRDIEDIEPGSDFVETLHEAIASCEVLLLLIGPQWVSSTREKQDQKDYVRIEVESALARGTRIIPVLVGGANMPTEEELPEGLQALATREALEITEKRWHYDVEQLIRALERIPGLQAATTREPAAKSSRLPLILGALGVVAISVLLGLWFAGEDPSPEIGPATATDEGTASEEAPGEDVPKGVPAGAETEPLTDTAANATTDFTGVWLDNDRNYYAIVQRAASLEVYNEDSVLIGTGRLTGEKLEIDFEKYQESGGFELAEGGETMSGPVTDRATGEKEYLILVRDVSAEAAAALRALEQ